MTYLLLRTTHSTTKECELLLTECAIQMPIIRKRYLHQKKTKWNAKKYRTQKRTNKKRNVQRKNSLKKKAECKNEYCEKYQYTHMTQI